MNAASPLRSREFRREREACWRELEALLERAGKVSLRGLSARELARLPVLHRQALSSLSVARAISLDAGLLAYLEGLARRSSACVYGVKTPLRTATLAFVLRRFPRAVRACLPEVLLAAALLAGGVACGLLLTLDDLERYHAFVPRELAAGRTPETPVDELAGVLEGTADLDGLAGFSSYLFTHNTRIGLLAFGLGIAAGLPTAWLLFWNGTVLGAMAALYHARGLGAPFWAWVLPHGVTELLAIVLFGAGGMVVARALLFPGAYRRRVQLARQGGRAGLLAVGGVLLLVLAALVEGFFRQLVHDETARGLVAGASAVAWAVYFTLGGRDEPAGKTLASGARPRRGPGPAIVPAAAPRSAP